MRNKSILTSTIGLSTNNADVLAHNAKNRPFYYLWNLARTSFVMGKTIMLLQKGVSDDSRVSTKYSHP